MIKKDIKTGEVIGFEKFNVHFKKGEKPSIKLLVKPGAEKAVF